MGAVLTVYCHQTFTTMNTDTIATTTIHGPSPFARNRVVVPHLGPYDVRDVTDDMLGDLVYNQKIPVIIRQIVGGEYVYAVLANNKDVRIACAGCFTRDMLITDSTRCKKCASFVKHWDFKDGVRRLECKNTSSDINEIAKDCGAVTLAGDDGYYTGGA